MRRFEERRKTSPLLGRLCRGLIPGKGTSEDESVHLRIMKKEEVLPRPSSKRLRRN